MVRMCYILLNPSVLDELFDKCGGGGWWNTDGFEILRGVPF